MPEFYLAPKGLVRRLPWLARLTHRIEAGIFQAVFWLIRRLSLERALGLSGALFYLAGRLSDKRRKADANLAIAFPEKDTAWRRRTTREIFRHLGYSVVELIKLDQIWAAKDRRIEFVLEDSARAHMERGGPTLFITAHVGPWQVTPLITREFNVAVSTVYAPESNPAMNELMRKLRKGLGDHLISAEAGPRPIMREFNAGRSIGVVMDTRPDTGKLVPFFGRDALTNTSAVGLCPARRRNPAAGARRAPARRSLPHHCLRPGNQSGTRCAPQGSGDADHGPRPQLLRGLDPRGSRAVDMPETALAQSTQTVIWTHTLFTRGLR
ncbi:MAG: hypothetical protein U5K56_12050 [Halioglobus sp.]|nr:hypothetical protein [Halioglobus sp.]